jgi:predicted Zn-dependent protease
MKRIFLLLVGVLSATGCATSPLGRSQFTVLPDNQVALMGAQAFANLKQKMPLDADRTANAYVECVAGAITREVGGQWDVAVFREDSPNAFALPGGKIGVHSGMLRVATNQHQLAAVLAHEVAHVLARHTNERISQEMAMQQGLGLIQAIANPVSPTGQALMGLLGVGAQYGVLMPYSRLQESEADLLGLDLMAKAGFDPRESINLWQNMARAGGAEPVEFLSTHPSSATRMQDLQQRIPKDLEVSRQARASGKNPKCDQWRGAGS